MEQGAAMQKNPRIAFPTLVLALVVTSGWALTIALVFAGALPYWAAVVISTPLAYIAFTPMHDATHGSVARAKWINAVVGRACGLVLFAPYSAFRWAHLTHHKHTNHADHDPDMWSATGPVWTHPLRWLTQDIGYYVHYVRAWKSRPVRERAETVGTLVSLVAVVALAFWAGYGWEVTLLWLVPARLALGLLAFLFDYVPHHPYAATAKEDRFAATRNLGTDVLSPFLLYQNWHLSHHLTPGVPFYRYGKAWRARFGDDPRATGPRRAPKGAHGAT
jgi:beta-carotene hydroxylase